MSLPAVLLPVQVTTSKCFCGSIIYELVPRKFAEHNAKCPAGGG